MLVDRNKCVGCGNCVAVCTMGVISVVDGRSQVNEDECVECSTCYRVLRSEGRNPTLVRTLRGVLKRFHLQYDMPPDVCPTGALTPPTLEWPRLLRAQFSDPIITHPSTGTGGRGTEEIKSNDVTGRLKEGEIGFVVELGRPGLGTRFHEIDKVARALAAAGALFEANNPVTVLMSDTTTGAIREDVLGEKVMSAIIECRGMAAQAPAILAALRDAAGKIDTVISAGISARCRPDGSVPYADIVRDAGLSLSLNAKTNLGLGRPLFEERPQSATTTTTREVR